MLTNLQNYFRIFEKSAAVLGAVIYLFFAVIVVKQVSTMTNNVNDKFNYVLIVFAYLHLAFSLLLVLLVLLIL